MGRIGINEKKKRRVETLMREKSKELKVVDAVRLLRPFSGGMRYAPNDWRAQDAMERRPARNED